MIYQNSMGLRKSRCDVFSGSPKDVFAIFTTINASIKFLETKNIITFIHDHISKHNKCWAN
jgi:hypothetical protein